MKENDKNVEQFIEKVMKETSLETPSFDFTSKVMAQVALEQSKTIAYKPLISKTTWIALFTGIAAVLAYAFFGGSPENKLDINISAFFSERISGLIPNLHFSDVTTYSVLIIAVMALVQIQLLKHYFDKRVA